MKAIRIKGKQNIYLQALQARGVAELAGRSASQGSGGAEGKKKKFENTRLYIKDRG